VKGLTAATLAVLVVILPAAGMAEGETMSGVTVSISSGEELTTHSVIRSPGSPAFQMEAMRIVPMDGVLARKAIVSQRFEMPFITSLEDVECVWSIEGLPAESGLALESDPTSPATSAALSGTPQEADEGRFEITITAQDANDGGRKASFTFDLEILGS